MQHDKIDIYERVTTQIIEAIEAGAGSYKMPWHITEADCFAPVNASSKKPYHGINVLILWTIAESRGYESGFWATYNQWRDLGAQVRKGERAAPVVFWEISAKGENQTAEDEKTGTLRMDRFVLAKGYSVFNAAQVDGFTPPTTPVLSSEERIRRADEFFAKLKIDIRHSGSVACYLPELDIIQMPPFGCFRDAVGYYSTLAHEAMHWAGASNRLGRNLVARFGSESYAMEELIAELGAAFICTELNISNTPRPDHAAYVANWLRVLRHDKRAIFTAASLAQRAVSWMTDRLASSEDGIPV